MQPVSLAAKLAGSQPARQGAKRPEDEAAKFEMRLGAAPRDLHPGSRSVRLAMRSLTEQRDHGKIFLRSLFYLQ